MFGTFMQGVCIQDTLEIMLPYAGIIRIRFTGMISAPVVRSTPAIIIWFPGQAGDDVISFLQV